MSDILIRGMDMPGNCWSCKMFCNCFACEGYDCHCAALGKDIGTEAEVPRNKRRDDCPLAPVPPHGRLIDADALTKHIKRDGIASDPFVKIVCDYFKDAPTIIPAEEG